MSIDGAVRGMVSAEMAPESADEQLPPADAQVIRAKPLTVSGLVVTKADLLDALRVFVPNVQDITTLDGDHFQLWLQPIASSRP